jgi:hypothetical protein
MGPGQVGPSCKSAYIAGFAKDLSNIRCKDEPELMHNAPTSIQVFTNRMRDEECLHVATIIDECLNKA